MHVPWQWAKQRPHFLAEYLGGFFDTKVFYKKAYRKKNFSESEKPSHLYLQELFIFPLGKKSVFIEQINYQLMKFQLRKELENCDYIWITHPSLFPPLSSFDYASKKLIYDCMDDALEFPDVKNNPKLRANLLLQEQALLSKADLTLCSSEHLQNKILHRIPAPPKTEVLNNAISGTKLIQDTQGGELPPEIQSKLDGPEAKFIYLGTISEWMDFELILKSLDRFTEIHYYFFGPREVNLPTHERIHYMGSVPHSLVKKVMEQADVLLMPFQLNDLILSVNPVKLYEYIYSNKAALIVRYGETLKFGDYVYLYEGLQEYLEIIADLINKGFAPKKSKEECQAYALANTWESRGERVRHLLDQL